MSGKFEYVVIDDRSKEEKLKDKLNETKEKVSEKASEAINWTKNNWQAVLAGAAVAIPLATSAVKLIKSLKGSAADRHEGGLAGAGVAQQADVADLFGSVAHGYVAPSWKNTSPHRI